MRTFIYPYMAGSRSVNALAKELGIRKIRRENSNYVAREGDVIINWGCSELPFEVNKAHVLNPPEKVSMCSNKLRFFKFLEENPEAVEGINVPDWTEDKKVVQEWLKKGDIVFGREKLTGNGGEGIVEYNPTNPNVEVADAPLYVKYVPKKWEYRVHVFGGKVLSVQRKALRNDVRRENANWRIRNHAGGFIFARNEDHEPSPKVLAQAERISEITNLDFFAVDIIYNQYQDKAYILEVNTAPGLEGTTLKEYVEAFTEVING